jgi:hypothetical protein
MGPVATIAYQTRYGEQARQNRLKPDQNSDQSPDQSSDANKPREDLSASLVNSCVAYAVEDTN